ncbi:mevalonate kinase family protein [Legionella pneumophila]
MKWQIPAKTFLLGEYAAIAGEPAILLTTNPCFALTLTENAKLEGIHPKSPAGLWWQKNQCHPFGLSWQDPYHGQGGLGASSAQFLACYLATCSLQEITPRLNHMLEAYYQSSWSGLGLRPSGYDVIAQSQQGCVYIDKQKNQVNSFSWPFKDLSFLIIHTGNKLATHHHLQEVTLPSQIDYLASLVIKAKEAFDLAHSHHLIQCINLYAQKLTELNLVSQHSLPLIQSIKFYPETLAIKGCGALGADTLLILTDKRDLQSLKDKVQDQNWLILATEDNLTVRNNNSLFEKSI